MQNTLDRRLLFALVLSLCVFTGTGSVFAVSPDDVASAVRNTYDKISETSTALFNPEAEDKKGLARTDPFYNKLQKKRDGFMKQRRKEQRRFFEKVREKKWDPEKTQEELRKFDEGQKGKIDKFMQKQKEKIDKHTEKLKSDQEG